MKGFLIFLIFFASLFTYSQRANIDIRLGCGFTGTSSEEFEFYKLLIKSKDYKKIRKNFNSNRLFDQLLGAIVLEELSKCGELVLSDQEKKDIEAVKTSSKTYSVCEGCISHWNGEIKDIFNHDPKDTSFLNLLLVLKRSMGLAE